MYPNVITEHFLGKCIAAMVALMYVGVAAVGSGLPTAVMILILAALPLVCIWFPGEMSNYVLPIIKFELFKRAPAFFVRGFGWGFLILVLGLTVVAS